MAEPTTGLAVVPGAQVCPRYVGVRHRKIEPLLARYERDPDPLNLFSELAMLRALLTLLIEDFADDSEDGTKSIKRQREARAGVRDCERLIDSIGRMVERLQEMRDGSKYSEAEMSALINRLGRVVDIVIPNGIINLGVEVEADLLTGAGLKQRIRDGWLREVV